MATVNYSVPDEVRDAFNAAFQGENKSAVIAQLMRQAVEEKERSKRRAEAADRLLELRRKSKPRSAAEIRRALESGRP